MSLCSCPPDALTSVAFADGTVLLRCGAHERQAWLVDGEPAPRQAALDGLRALFTEQRYQRARRPRRPRPAVVDLVVPAPRMVPPAVVRLDPPRVDAHQRDRRDGELLTALLQARGLPGTWAVA